LGLNVSFFFPILEVFHHLITYSWTWKIVSFNISHPDQKIGSPLFTKYLAICSFPLFFALRYFYLQAQSLFKQVMFVCLSFQAMQVIPNRLLPTVSIPLLLSRLVPFTLVNWGQKVFLIPFCVYSPSFLSISNSVLILFLIGKVVTGIFRSHRIHWSHSATVFWSIVLNKFHKSYTTVVFFNWCARC